MRPRVIPLALAVSLLALPLSHAVAAPVPRAPAPGAAVAAAPDSARIVALLSKADASLQAGRVKEAVGVYRAIIGEQRNEGQYAGRTLWLLAQTYYATDDLGRAASVLDELAEAAGQYGDPVMELKATFESALLNQAMKKPAAVAARIPRIKALLQSPAVSLEQKRQVESRLAVKQG
jgi:hypothetical protein